MPNDCAEFPIERSPEMSRPRYFCLSCNDETELLTIKEAMYEAGVCRRTMHYWIKRGALHLMQEAGGRTRICKRSLIRPYTKG